MTSVESMELEAENVVEPQLQEKRKRGGRGPGKDVSEG